MVDRIFRNEKARQEHIESSESDESSGSDSAINKNDYDAFKRKLEDIKSKRRKLNVDMTTLKKQRDKLEEDLSNLNEFELNHAINVTKGQTYQEGDIEGHDDIRKRYNPNVDDYNAKLHDIKEQADKFNKKAKRFNKKAGEEKIEQIDINLEHFEKVEPIMDVWRKYNE